MATATRSRHCRWSPSRGRSSSSGCSRYWAPARACVTSTVAAGVLFGACKVAVKALTGLVEHDGLAGLMTPWLLLAAAASFVALFASARSLQVGGAVEVIAVTGAGANLSCIAGGLIVFGDPLAGDAMGVAAQATAFLLVVAAAALMPAPRTQLAAA